MNNFLTASYIRLHTAWAVFSFGLLLPKKATGLHQGDEDRESLETDDWPIVESRQANALDHLRRLFKLTEADPVVLSSLAFW